MSDNELFSVKSRGLMLGVGGLLMAISPYLTWVSLGGLINVDLFALVRFASYRPLLAYAPVILGIILVSAVAASLAHPSVIRALAVTYSLTLPIFGGLATAKLFKVVEDSQGALHIGIGVLALGAAEVLFFVAGLYPSRNAVSSYKSPVGNARTSTVSLASVILPSGSDPSKVMVNVTPIGSEGVRGVVTKPTTSQLDSGRASKLWCESCEIELSPGYVFCPKCGQHAKSIVDSRCHLCRGNVDQDDEYCHSCGHKLDELWTAGD